MPEMKFLWESKFDIGTVFNIIAAVATAVAAIAAFRSAKSASETVKDSRSFARIQISTAHYQAFDNVLDGAESDFNIKFLRRIHLYDNLFPGNRYPDRAFSLVADREWLDSWAAVYDELGGLTLSSNELSHEQIADWISECHDLAYNLNFNFSEPRHGAVVLHINKRTDFAGDPGMLFYQIGDVLHRLARFGLREQADGMLIRDNSMFMQAYRGFYNAVKDGLTDHKLT